MDYGDKGLRCPYLNFDCLEEMVQNFVRASQSKEIIYNHQDIRSLYWLNTLRPLFSAQRLAEEQTENLKSATIQGI